jgi:hypothetical protein
MGCVDDTIGVMSIGYAAINLILIGFVHDTFQTAMLL